MKRGELVSEFSKNVLAMNEWNQLAHEVSFKAAISSTFGELLPNFYAQQNGKGDLWGQLLCDGRKRGIFCGSNFCLRGMSTMIFFLHEALL